MNSPDKRLRVLHVVSGDRWAGAEAQAFTLLKKLNSRVELRTVVLNFGELATKLQDYGISTTIIDETKENSWSILKQIRTIISRFSPDIIHTHRQKENILTSLANLTTARCKSVRTQHGAPEFKPKGKQKLQVVLDELVGKYLQQKVIAVSTDLGNQLAAKFKPSHIEVIANGVDAAALREGSNADTPIKSTSDVVNVGIIGRLEPVKRIDIFLQIAALLSQNHPLTQWRFHILGDGSLRKEMEQLSSQLNIASHTIFHGHCGNMPAHISALDLVLMTSDHEGLPMIALEATALHVPVIAHATGGLIELLSKVDDSMLIANNTPKSYIAPILNRLKSNSTIALPREYSADENADKVLRLYKSLTNK